MVVGYLRCAVQYEHALHIAYAYNAVTCMIARDVLPMTVHELRRMPSDERDKVAKIAEQTSHHSYPSILNVTVIINDL